MQLRSEDSILDLHYTMNSPLKNITIAVGPVMPGIGSWAWVGEDLLQTLSAHFHVTTWSKTIPKCDAAIIVKYGFSAEVVKSAGNAPLIYMPIDHYGSSADIDRHGRLLAQSSRIVSHSESLTHYFASYAQTDYVDHALRYVGIAAADVEESHQILCVGMRRTLDSLAAWTRSNRLPGTLLVLTNLRDGETADPAQFGFSSKTTMQIEQWSIERHIAAVESSRLAIDIKGQNFRQRHKPPAKAFDFLASGLPLAMNANSSSVRHIAEMGFQIADPRDVERWTSPEYRLETQQFGAFIREQLSSERVGERLRRIVVDVLSKDRNSPKPTVVQLQNMSNSSNCVPSQEAGFNKPRIAILSFLFNWPSTGGGIIHTVELAQFLRRSGHEVEIIAPRFDPWSIGQVDETCPIEITQLHFTPADWNAAKIRKRFRQAVDQFSPDHVIITDCWNFKPHLALAVDGYSYFLRMQAQELLCPLNNLRLLPVDNGPPEQCPADQLSEPKTCFNCLSTQGHVSGELHKAERQLSGVGCEEYTELLQTSLRNAAAVLTLNPEVAERFREYADRVEVVTWGMDSARFPWPRFPRVLRDTNIPIRILFAGVATEAIKGFDVLHEACKRLSTKRNDFELVLTHEPAGRLDEFTTAVGWKTQSELPSVYADCDIVAVPTIAQDGLSRTSVEAMATGLPVIASRLGGLPFSVEDGVTGLLCNAGDPADWCEKLERLLDDSTLRTRMGLAGRKAFEERFTWEGVIVRDYDRLFLEQIALVEAP